MMTSEFSIANSSSVWSDSRCVSGSRSLHKCTSDVAKDKTKPFSKRPQPWGWRTLPYNYMACIRGCAIGQSVVLLLPCSVSVTNQCLTCTQAHWEIAQDKTKWLETSKARGIKRKAGRPNVLWAKIYIQRESTWEWLRSPIILLRATHNQSHVHIRDLTQTATKTSTPRSLACENIRFSSLFAAGDKRLQRRRARRNGCFRRLRGRECRDLGRVHHRSSPNFNVKQAAGVNTGFAFTVSKTQGRRNYWKTSYWDVTTMSY